MKKGKIIFQIVKLLVIIISVAYIIFKLNHDEQGKIIYTQLKTFNHLHYVLLLGVLILTLLNWFLESLKFRLLVNHIQHISLKKSMQAILAGLTVSIFTPKRIGEFGGRIFVLHNQNRVNGIFATLLGNLSQLLITLIVGIICLPYFLSQNTKLLHLTEKLSLGILLIVVVIMLLLFVYFNIARVGKLLLHIKFFQKHINFIHFLQHYKISDLLSIIGLSLIRYMVFTFQFYALIRLFGIELNYFTVMLAVSQIYLIMAVLPTFALGELGVRGSVAIWVFSSYTIYTSGILAASMLLWVINLALPALIGIYFLSKLRY